MTFGGLRTNQKPPSSAPPAPSESNHHCLSKPFGRRQRHDTMRQRASLDIIADDRAGPIRGPSQDDDADQEPLNHAREDSRSTSSTSSPAPADNDESDFFLGANDSESSLGVPNLQDMQVNDDECLPPVNRLPNEILISVFAKLSSSADLLHVMLTCKRWSRNAVDLLWHRPACSTWDRHKSICQTLGFEKPYFAYRDSIKRLNLASLADRVNDGSVMPLAVCPRVERLTLSGCRGLTDQGLIALVQNNTHLLALDISLDEQITEASIFAIAENCQKLQGLNVSGCVRISNESLAKLAQSCRFVKRLKLNDCSQLSDSAVLAFAENCPNILEIDLHQCRLVGNEPVTALLAKGQSLRELRLVNCDLIDDSAFLSLPAERTYQHLRILDLTSCSRLTDRAVERIIAVAPRLRNLVLAKCRNITDAAVYAIAGLGKNLHYVHLGHCGNITDNAVKRLVHQCNRIRYIDLGCCSHLTDESVTRLASLPKLKRIGLVKCSAITDRSVYALAQANQRVRTRRDADGNYIAGDQYVSSTSSLERVHLSYCTNLSLQSIITLLNCCPKLTHLSLTGVPAFLREDLDQFCRDAPSEFTDHQRQVFCVFSGQGVISLRRYFKTEPAFANLQGNHAGDGQAQPPIPPPQAEPTGHGHGHTATLEAAFDDVETDAVDDDEGLEDSSEMVVDVQATATHHADHAVDAAPFPMSMPTNPAPAPNSNLFGWVGGHPPYVPQQVRFHDDPMAFAQVIPARQEDSEDDEDEADTMDFVTLAPATAQAFLNAGASLAGPASRSHQASGGGASAASMLHGVDSRLAPGGSTSSA